MSSMEMTGRDTDFPGQLTFEQPNARILGGLIGNTTPVAPETSTPSADSPNSELYGAQPESTTSPVTDDASAGAHTEHQPRHAAVEPEIEDTPLSMNPDLRDDFTWRGRVQHVADAPQGWSRLTENAFGKRELVKQPYIPPTPPEGTVVAKTVETKLDSTNNAETAIIEAIDDVLPSLDEPQEPGRTRWYNPADWARAAHIKLRPELWTRRTNAAVLAGSIAMTAAGAVMTYYGAKHGGGHQIAHDLWGIDTNSHAPAHHNPHMPADVHTGPTTPPHTDAPSQTTTPEPHAPGTEQQTPQPEQPTTPTPQPEHHRTAVGYDQDTQRASTATDWSRDALRAAGKDAGLSSSQIDKLVHNQHNINQVNDALYADNRALAADHSHLLNAHERYDVTGQDTTAHTIVAELKPEHATTDANTDAHTGPANSIDTPNRLSDEEIDKQLRDLQKEIDAPVVDTTAAAPAHTAEHAQAGLTGDETLVLSAGAGIIATGGIALAYKARHRANVAHERANEWGGRQPHRAGTYNGQHYVPTVPSWTNPRKHWAFEVQSAEEKKRLATV